VRYFLTRAALLVALAGGAAPASAAHRVQGVPIQINNVARTMDMGDLWAVGYGIGASTKIEGRVNVHIPAGCSYPALGPAYAQRVEAAGHVYTTIHTAECSYEVQP